MNSFFTAVSLEDKIIDRPSCTTYLIVYARFLTIFMSQRFTLHEMGSRPLIEKIKLNEKKKRKSLLKKVSNITIIAFSTNIIRRVKLIVT